ncbi:uncharacterized protein LOC124808011 isoform X1 [Hydra vulgaris]|uniref:uncharacterized protein LOC124808011 isoform X1 n=1 Tax=Hydra vulgaris TaxID=6087 RepID=UPI001F5EA39C|nr:uncharacterized protein LOC124808011 isoform X1 [Hydra vulgaris]
MNLRDKIAFGILGASISFVTIRWLLCYVSYEWIYKLESIEEIGSFSIVKDIRGEEPYMTIKMRCFYDDNRLYGNAWEAIMKNNSCHAKLFQKCFRNRTVPGRQETHVLTFTLKKGISQCVCVDVTGWCLEVCENISDIRCCLDRGEQSVLCRG